MISYSRLREIEDILADVTYKPHWDLRFRQSGLDSYLSITMRVPNTWSERREPVKIGQDFLLPSRFAFGVELDRRELLQWVKFTILKLEEHELDENLRFRGEFVNHPHPQPISA